MRAFTHSIEELGKKRFHCLDIAVRELRGDEACDLPVAVVAKLMDERNRIPADEVREPFFFPGIDVVKLDGVVLL